MNKRIHKDFLRNFGPVFLLTVSGALLRLYYVLRIPYFFNQHDAGDFTRGHIGYINYFLENHFRLPDFNPTTVWSFYHPPLHHYLAALWAKGAMLLGAGAEAAMESVQLLTLAYGILILIAFYRLLVFFRLKGYALILPYALLCFHPSLILLSGSVNNDQLCLLLMLLTIYSALCWYEKPTYKNIVLTALLLAATVLTKMSGLLLAPAIGFLFLCRLFKDRGQGKCREYWKQYFLFGGISIPLAMSFSIRNLIRWRVNPFYTLSLGDYMNTGSGLADRLFRIYPEQLQSPFVIYNLLPRDMLAVERNIPLYLLKTSMFGDNFFLESGSAWIPAAWLLHAVNLLLIALALTALIYEVVSAAAVMAREKKWLGHAKEIYLFLLYGCTMGSYLLFCFRYPNCCSQDFRYISLGLFVHMIFLGLALLRLKERRPGLYRVLAAAGAVLTGVFAVLAALLFLNCSNGPAV